MALGFRCFNDDECLVNTDCTGNDATCALMTNDQRLCYGGTWSAADSTVSGQFARRIRRLQRMTWWEWMVVGFGIALFVVLLTCFIKHKHRVHRRKKKQIKAKIKADVDAMAGGTKSSKKSKKRKRRKSNGAAPADP